MNARTVLLLAVMCSILLIICSGSNVSAQPASPHIQPSGDSSGEIAPSTEEMIMARKAGLTTLSIMYFLIPLGLAITIFVIILGRAVAQPASISVATFAAPRDTVEDVSTYIRNTTNKLVWMGFTPMLDFTIPEVQHKGFYRWMSDDNGDHTVLIFEVTPAGVAGALARVRFIEFQTLLDSGARINTSNNPLKNPLVPPPTYLVTAHKGIDDPKELFEIHLKNVERMQMEHRGRIRPQKLEDFERELAQEWRELMQYQTQIGLMKLKRDGRTYQGTGKLILNYFIPGLIRRPPMKRLNEPIDPGHFS